MGVGMESRSPTSSLSVRAPVVWKVTWRRAGKWEHDREGWSGAQGVGKGEEGALTSRTKRRREKRERRRGERGWLEWVRRVGVHAKVLKGEGSEANGVRCRLVVQAQEEASGGRAEQRGGERQQRTAVAALPAPRSVRVAIWHPVGPGEGEPARGDDQQVV